MELLDGVVGTLTHADVILRRLPDPLSAVPVKGLQRFFHRSSSV